MKSRTKPVSEIRLASFGGVIGLIFEGGGYAEIVMNWVEVGRLIEA